MARGRQRGCAVSASSSLGQLIQAAKDLRRQWSVVQEHWRDDNCRRFEQKYLTPLLARQRRVEVALGHMASILQHARRDCE